MAAQAPLLRIGMSKFNGRSFADFQKFLSVPHWNGLSALSSTIITVVANRWIVNRASPENALFPRRHTLQDKAFQTFRKENCFWERYYDFESKNR
jgi:hypothetical protein